MAIFGLFAAAYITVQEGNQLQVVEREMPMTELMWELLEQHSPARGTFINGDVGGTLLIQTFQDRGTIGRSLTGGLTPLILALPLQPYRGGATLMQSMARPRVKNQPREVASGLRDQQRYLTYEETVKGSAEPGKLADFVILSQDILTVPEEQIRPTQPVATYGGGQKVFSTAEGS